MTQEQTPTFAGGGGLADPSDTRASCGVGVVMDLDGGSSHETVSDGLDLLANLEHRGTTGAEENTGDGAGIMLQVPHKFFSKELDISLPDLYAVGSLFFPQNEAATAALKETMTDVLARHDVSVLGWRDVPTDNAGLGQTALDSEPDVQQVIVAPTDDCDEETFDRRLYVGRCAVESEIVAQGLDGASRFYICSLDRKTLVYKGLLTAKQLSGYYPDLRDERLRSTFVMVHARFSTNTLGAWHLAHPYRTVIHNGEFNTIQGNINWMRARENDLAHEAFETRQNAGTESNEESQTDLDSEEQRSSDNVLDTLKPIIDDEEQSDTASVDNALELLMKTGRDLPHALRMLIPEAWRGEGTGVEEARQNWYDFHASLIEPWDGPALVAATDGNRVGAVLDRNGLRPCRYDVLEDDTLVVASEVGALDVQHDASRIRKRGRLQPGQLFLADPEEGRIVPDSEVFEDLVDEKYDEWVSQEQLRLDEIAGESKKVRDPVDDLCSQQALFGYTHDELDNLIEPMARNGKDPVGSMGDDTPLSVLSEFNRPLSSYFKQKFAQVTNPPLDYIREELVTSMECRLGNQRNLLDESPEHARQLVLSSPFLTNEEMATISELDGELSSTVIDITYPQDGDLESAIEDVRSRAERLTDEHDVLVLSDRNVGEGRLPIPSLLATGAVHHHLVRTGQRNRVGVVLESGDPRTVHQMATLVGYGAGAINPYLATQTIADIVAGPDGAESEEAIEAYLHALEDGLLKTMAKMGISTVESYRGAQIFEAVGLDSSFVAEYFEGTTARTGGIATPELEDDLRQRYASAFPEAEDAEDPDIERQGEFEHRSNGVFHQWNPETVGTLQKAVRQGDYEQYQDFAQLINDQNEQLQTLRGLLTFETERESVPIKEVEPVHEIVTRFSTAAMSLGSLSPEAHENNAIAMNRLGGKSNTGEGGEPPDRFDTEKECNVKQVASGRFGVTSHYLSSAEELQIKMAQGSKPGEGGHLPGEKVNDMIAHVRCSTPGVGLISPPPLHDIYSIEDLKQLIHDLKTASPDADINVKLVSEAGIGTIAAGVAKANADVVHISGHSGGTGASPKTSIKNAGLPWELGLAEANQMLRHTDLRSRIRVTVDGGMKTGRDVAVAALLGGEEYIFGTASLVTSGCVMARQCHENTCPVGVATQDENLRNRFPGQPQHVINYMTFIAQELREIMAELGFRTVEEMIGRVECLSQREEITHEKAQNIDLSAVLAQASGDRTKSIEQTHEIDTALDHDLISEAAPAFDRGEPVYIDREIDTTHRAVGAMLSNRISNEYGSDGLPEDTIAVDFDGVAGQSFGAFLASGVTMSLTGTANDYVGKGLSGGKLIVTTPTEAPYEPEDNTLIGNVALYGATQGELYVNGMAGERFAVRNSGVKAVVESVGDHGCEYMTGGVVAVLGETGRNFAAGMSGGVAYVLDREGDFEEYTNHGMISTEKDLEPKDDQMLRRLIENHVDYTNSDRGEYILEHWEEEIEQFVKVMPDAYADIITEKESEDVRRNLPARSSSITDDDTAAVRGGAD